MRDLGSSNGTFVNGQRVDRLQSEGVELFSGDYLQFGEDVDDNFCVRATVRLLPEEGIAEGENRTEVPLISISGMRSTTFHTYLCEAYSIRSTSVMQMPILKSTSMKKSSRSTQR